MPSAADHIRNSFAALAPQADELVAAFYENLFRDHPEVRPMFPEDMTEQRKHLAAAVALVVKHADRLADIETGLAEMGARHVGYGAKPEHYPVVRDTLLATLEQFAGSLWNDDLEAAWTGALNTIAGYMLAGADASKQAA